MLLELSCKCVEYISYWDQSSEQRARLGIKDNLVRFSCGVEAFDDIESDILQALKDV